MNVHAPPMQPDEAEIRLFFAAYHEAASIAFEGVADPGVLQLSRLHPADEKLQVVGRYRIGDTDRMTAQAVADAAAGFNVYVEGRTVRKSTRATERGKLDDTIGVFALVIDADADKGREGVLPADVEPSLSVESSHGNRHDWFFLAKALPPTEAQALGAAIRAVTGADDDTGNVTQPYRVAGTPNFPGAKKAARGRVPAPTSVLTEGRNYTPAELEALFPASSASLRTAPAIQSCRDLGDLLAGLSAKRGADLAAADAGDRSAHFLRVTGWLKGDGYSAEEATLLWEAFPDGAGLSKYGARLPAEVARAWGKTNDDTPVQREALVSGLLRQALKDQDGISAPLRGTILDLGVDVPFVPTPELIRDTLPRTGFAFIGGQSGAGKSFLMGALGLCLMTGDPFAGRKVDRTGGVLVLASEGQGTLAGRMKALRSTMPDPARRLPIVAIGDFGPISKLADYIALHSRIRDVSDRMQADHGVPLVAFFLDTISAFQMIGDDKENDPAAWNSLMAPLKEISEDVGALAIGVHHYGKNASAGLRGSSAAWANADAILAVTGERNVQTGEVADRALALVKNRNGPEGPIGAVTFQPVVIGHREDGSEVRSLVFSVDTAIGAPVAGTQRRPLRMNKAEKAFVDAFSAATIDHAASEHVHGETSAPRIRAVDRIHVRREFDRRYITGQDDERKRADTLRKQFANGLERAERAGAVASGTWSGTEWIWSLEPDYSGLKSSVSIRNGTE